VFLAVGFVDRQSRLRWSKFSVLLYLDGGSFGFLATQNHVFQVSRLALSGDVILDFLDTEQIAASFNLIDLSCDVSFEIRKKRAT
jgi:hypothetical protein